MLQKWLSVTKQNVFSPLYFYFNIFSTTSLHKTHFRSGCWSVQCNTAYFSLTEKQHFCIWNWIFVCEHMCISPAAALLSLNILIYDSFILIIALALLQKIESAVYFHCRFFDSYWNNHTQGLWVTKENHLSDGLMFCLWSMQTVNASDPSDCPCSWQTDSATLWHSSSNIQGNRISLYPLKCNNNVHCQCFCSPSPCLLVAMGYITMCSEWRCLNC